MIAKTIINKDFVPLTLEDAASSALAKMDAWHTTCLPVLEPATRRVVGTIILDDIVDLQDESVPISVLDLKPVISVYEHQHLFEVARLMLLHEIRLIAITDESDCYIGVIEKKSVLEEISEMLNVSVLGSVITIKIPVDDYSLTEPVHLIESEKANILGVTAQQSDKSEPVIQVSFKLNIRDTSIVSSALRRHGYEIISENNSDLLNVDFSDRADEVIRYLDI
ncbi:MAG: CBS domain-containing protein [Balneolaceae bacterium]